MATADPLAMLARRVGGERAVADVVLARDAPDAYVRKHARDLRRRGPIQPAALIANALMDAMRKARRAVELDRRALPDEAVAELRRLRPALSAAAWKRIELAAAPPIELLVCELARAVAASSPTRMLALFDGGSDSIIVVALERAAFAEAARLARRTRVGSLHDAARMRVRPRSARTHRPRGWPAVLASFGVTTTHGALLAAVRDGAIATRLAEHVREAPARERPVVEALLALLRGRAVPRDPLVRLEALRYLGLVAGHELRCVQGVADVLARAGSKPSVALRRAAVAAVRFPRRAAAGAAAFAKLPSGARRALRELVTHALSGRDVPSLIAALDAACVVGDASMRPQVAALARHPVPLVASSGRQATRMLAK